jgi:hypothetical protein
VALRLPLVEVLCNAAVTTSEAETTPPFCSDVELEAVSSPFFFLSFFFFFLDLELFALSSSMAADPNENENINIKNNENFGKHHTGN